MKKVFRGAALLIIVLLLGVAGLMAYGTSQLDAGLQLAPENLAVPNDAATIAEGERLVAIHQCIECHGENLGGTEFIASDAFMHLPAPNLTRGAGGLAGGPVAFAEGVRPDGTSVDVNMPWRGYARLNDEEIAALWSYLTALPAIRRARE